jgi:hypothetical protein
MDLNPEGYKDRNAVNGSFYKLTFRSDVKSGQDWRFLQPSGVAPVRHLDGLEQQTG